MTDIRHKGLPELSGDAVVAADGTRIPLSAIRNVGLEDGWTGSRISIEDGSARHVFHPPLLPPTSAAGRDRLARSLSNAAVAWWEGKARRLHAIGAPIEVGGVMMRPDGTFVARGEAGRILGATAVSSRTLRVMHGELGTVRPRSLTIDVGYAAEALAWYGTVSTSKPRQHDDRKVSGDRSKTVEAIILRIVATIVPDTEAGRARLAGFASAIGHRGPLPEPNPIGEGGVGPVKKMIADTRPFIEMARPALVGRGADTMFFRIAAIAIADGHDELRLFVLYELGMTFSMTLPGMNARLAAVRKAAGIKDEGERSTEKPAESDTTTSRSPVDPVTRKHLDALDIDHPDDIRSLAVLRAFWMTKLKTCHPDRLGPDATPADRERAETRTKEANVAYAWGLSRFGG